MTEPTLTVKSCDRCKDIYVPNTTGTEDGDVPQLCPKCKKDWDALHKQHHMKTPIMIEPPVFKDPEWPTVDIHVSKEIWERVAAPNHYVDRRKYEPAKVAYDWELNFNTGSALKYISRLGRKKGATYEEDICKAIRFLMLELEAIQDHRN